MGTNQVAAWEGARAAFNTADLELKRLANEAALTINALRCEWPRMRPKGMVHKMGYPRLTQEFDPQQWPTRVAISEALTRTVLAYYELCDAWRALSLEERGRLDAPRPWVV